MSCIDLPSVHGISFEVDLSMKIIFIVYLCHRLEDVLPALICRLSMFL